MTEGVQFRHCLTRLGLPAGALLRVPKARLDLSLGSHHLSPSPWFKSVCARGIQHNSFQVQENVRTVSRPESAACGDISPESTKRNLPNEVNSRRADAPRVLWPLNSGLQIHRPAPTTRRTRSCALYVSTLSTFPSSGPFVLCGAIALVSGAILPRLTPAAGYADHPRQPRP